MKIAVALFFVAGIGLGFFSGLDNPSRPVEPIPPLPRPPLTLHLELDAPRDGRNEEYLTFVAPVSASISRATPKLSTAKRRSFLMYFDVEGEYRVLVTTIDGRPRVDHNFVIGPGVTHQRLLVPTSTRAPAEAGIAVYAVDPDHRPTRFDRVTGWVDHEGRVSRADLSVGTAQSDGSMLIPIGAHVNRVLTGRSAGRLRLLIESDALGAAWIEVPKPADPDAPRASAAIASVTVQFAIPALPQIVVTPSAPGGEASVVDGALAGRLRVVARPAASTEIPSGAGTAEARVSAAGRAHLPPLGPGPYELTLLLDSVGPVTVAPFSGTIELLRHRVDLTSYGMVIPLNVPALYPMVVNGKSTVHWTDFTLHRAEQRFGAGSVPPGGTVDLHSLPAGRYELRTSDGERTFEVPTDREVAL